MKQATDEERQAVWKTLLLRSTRGVLSPGDIVQTAAHFHLSRFVVARIWERGISSMGDRVAAVVKSRKSARGRKKLDRAVLCEHVSAVPVNERENHRKIQQASNTSSYLIQQLIKEGYMRRALRQTRSLLTASHKVARLKLAVNHVKLNGDGQYYFDPMFDVVHIDEKWLYVKKIAQRVYVLTGKDGTPLEEAPVQYVQSKRHIKKVMFLCAVARPRGDWDGKIGLWPVVETYITQRWGVNRPAGVEEIKPVSMNRILARVMPIAAAREVSKPAP
ncbi:hypothetical protein PF007_g17669 [Phytophthora fragariae]|uniref:DUF7769 domain-containing protein n=4 Tax=Phytophthora fragariae TaxID=53985 RepID=A0A6A4CR49_9STRA|nr:hypothetical protein PF007_g17669 [Phytophthora fragariae]KAE9194423.1 hypothetical protein PF004_g20727 [Phytophthora fragariae]KAE9292792.1 hypothetical protein PF001_g18555 [Phytophthora fragariae]